MTPLVFTLKGAICEMWTERYLDCPGLRPTVRPATRRWLRRHRCGLWASHARLSELVFVRVQDIVYISERRIRTFMGLYGPLRAKDCSRCPELGQVLKRDWTLSCFLENESRARAACTCAGNNYVACLSRRHKAYKASCEPTVLMLSVLNSR